LPFPGAIYPILDLDTVERENIDPFSLVALWHSRSLRAYQLRAKRTTSAEYLALAVALKNHRPDMALLANDFVEEALANRSVFAGLHLGQEDLLQLSDPLRRKFALASQNGFLSGLSTHNLEQIKTFFTRINDKESSIRWGYLAIGPLFPTGSKPGGVDPVIDDVRRGEIFAYLAAKTKSGPFFPTVVLIGGLTPGNYGSIVFADFVSKYGFRPVPALISSALKKSELEAWNRLIESYNT